MDDHCQETKEHKGVGSLASAMVSGGGNVPAPSNGRQLNSLHLRALRLPGWMDLQRDLSLSVSLGPIHGSRALRFGVKRNIVLPLQKNP